MVIIINRRKKIKKIIRKRRRLLRTFKSNGIEQIKRNTRNTTS